MIVPCCLLLADDNPIELGFNTLKAFLRRHRAGVEHDPVMMCFIGLNECSSCDKAAEWFRFRGYPLPMPVRGAAGTHVACVLSLTAACGVVWQTRIRKRKQQQMMS